VGASLPVVRVGRDVARLARIDRSLVGLRAADRPFARVPRPDPLVVHLPGVTRVRTGSPLLELGGEVFDRPLRSIARNVLRRCFTDGQIDDLLNREVVTYDDVVEFLRQSDEGNGTVRCAQYGSRPGRRGDAAGARGRPRAHRYSASGRFLRSNPRVAAK
jgi:hypothetical protein